MASKDPKVSKQGTAGKRKHTILCETHNFNNSSETWNNQEAPVVKPKCGYSFIQHWIGNCVWYTVMDKPIMIFNDIK